MAPSRPDQGHKGPEMSIFSQYPEHFFRIRCGLDVRSGAGGPRSGGRRSCRSVLGASRCDLRVAWSRRACCTCYTPVTYGCRYPLGGGGAVVVTFPSSALQVITIDRLGLDDGDALHCHSLGSVVVVFWYISVMLRCHRWENLDHISRHFWRWRGTFTVISYLLRFYM